MFRNSGKKVLVGTGNGYGYGYGIVRQLPYEQQMLVVLNEFIMPYIISDYNKVNTSFATLYRNITTRLNPYRSFTAVRITLKSLDIMQKGMNLVAENKSLKQQIEVMIEANRTSGLSKAQKNLNITTSFHVTAEIDSVYFAYILRYGPPKDGIFDSWLLSTMYDFLEQQTFQTNYEENQVPADELTVPLI